MRRPTLPSLSDGVNRFRVVFALVRIDYATRESLQPGFWRTLTHLRKSGPFRIES